MDPLKKRIYSYNGFSDTLAALNDARHGVLVKNVPGALPVLVASYLFEKSKRPLLLVAETLEDAEEFADDLTILLGENVTSLFPGLPDYHRELNPIELSERAEVMMTLARAQQPLVVAPASALLDPLPDLNDVSRNTYTLAKGEVLPRDSLIQFLHESGYTREVMVEGVGQYAVRGAVLDIYPYGGASAVRVEYFGDDIDDLRSFDPQTQRSTGRIEEITIMAAETPGVGNSHLLQHLPENTIVVWAEGRPAYLAVKERYDERTAKPGLRLRDLKSSDDTEEDDEEHLSEDLHDIVYEEDEKIPVSIPEQVRALREPGKWMEPELIYGAAQKLSQVFLHTTPYPTSETIDFGGAPQERFASNLPLLADRVKEYSQRGLETLLLCDNQLAADRLGQVLIERGVPESAFSAREGGLRHGFMLEPAQLVVLVDHDIFGRKRRKRQFMKFKNAVPLHDIDALKIGDFVVHVEHGIGRYCGLTKIAVGGVQREVLQIEYRDGIKLFVKLENLAQVQKYSAKEGFQPPLSKIGGKEWREIKRKTKESLVSIAEDLIKLYAKRRAERGIMFSGDTPWQREMEASFPYEDTPDQLTASEAVKRDMESLTPMDRLICGDVGYGKTEVAMRAAFKAVTDGKQVAVLVPTTILAQQHYRVFRERFKNWPVEVRVMSRFQSAREQKETVKRLSDGDVDVIVGTHRLLSKDVQFEDLGLLIIDEEHRFGVVQKEKIRSLRSNVDVLAMSATPIPRTLHMALMGARDLSQITTPPPGRQPIETDVVPFSEKVIKEAIHHELTRGGQVFFVHNRIQSITQVSEMIHRLLPSVRIGVAHGQMNERELEQVMFDFAENNLDILVSTMIIESGLDMPNVNTMIINRADRLGVAQLHQLRGRIGRSSRKAYAYLVVPPHFEMSKIARSRLAALTNFSSLGAGFQVAMRDLEIRGAGNLLGREQSGYINSIGFEMYQQLIEEAVQEVQVEKNSLEIEEKREVKLKIDTDAFLPEHYLPEGGLRLNIYRELARAKDFRKVDEMAGEVEDRFGKLPDAARNLFAMVRIRILAERAGVDEVNLLANLLELKFTADHAGREKMLLLVSRSEGFPIEFDATKGVAARLPLKKENTWESRLARAEEYLSAVAGVELVTA
ncbi:MAG: transcription-repair coupling factor [Calditrichaeota bacterium]|nr:transcription-repair coupling factor [Calditrichota bacterium]